MSQSDFKNINVVPIGNEFVDLILSRIHRQTPTLLLRKGFNINSLRQFYTRKVKKIELSFRDKLSTIIDEFPRFDEIHPLYSDLLGSIFDRGRYKLALDQVNTTRHLITKTANDYVELLKFGKSLKHCKALKVGAIRRMYSVINEITPSLAYLEQIRQHMLKLPSIDPNSPTLLISRYPNLEKTCFMNRVATDDDDSITKSVVFVVGHTDYKGLRYQVIDAPGVLDKPTFGACNGVISALANHLPKSLVLFFLDVSCSYGYSIAHQAAFFHSLKSVFVKKPFLIVCDESDLTQLSEQDLKLIGEMSSGMGANDEDEEAGEVVLKICDLTMEEGVISVKNAVCERLLDNREALSSCVAQAHEECKDKKIPETCDDDRNVDEDEEDEFEMAEERFTEEQKDHKHVAISKIQALRILIGLVFFILVGNTYGGIRAILLGSSYSYGAIQECLSALSF